MTRALCLAVVLLALALAPPPARAEDGPMNPGAKAHLDRGLELYGAQDFEGAIAEFKAGYQVQARRELLFAWAQAERLSGDCPSAVVLYRRFLESRPAERQAEAARVNMERCEKALSSSETTPGDGQGQEPGPADGAHPEQAGDQAAAARGAGGDGDGDRPRRGGRRRNTLGIALLGSGAVALAAGGGFLFAARSDGQAADDIAARAAAGDPSALYSDYSDRVADAELKQTLGLAVGGVGLALVTGGIVSYLLHDSGSSERSTIAVWSDGASGGVVLGGRF